MGDDREAIEVGLSVLRHEMKANEEVRTLFTDYPEDEATGAMINAFQQVMSKIENSKKAENVVGIMEMFARQVQSDAMMKAVLEEARDNELIELEEQEVN